MKCKWCDKAEDQCICDPAAKAQNVKLAELQSELGELATKMAGDGVNSEGMTEIQGQIKTLTDQVTVLTADREKLEAKSTQDAVADQIKALTEVVGGLTEVRTHKKIEFPVDNDRAGSCDASTKMWANILIGNVGMTDGNLSYTAKGGESKLAEMKQFAERAKLSTKALSGSGSATQGTEWVLTGVMDEFFDLLRLGNELLAKLPDFPMSSNSDTIPIQVSDMEWYKEAESTDNDDTGVTASQLGTGVMTVQATKFMGRTWYSAELNEDSIVPLVPKLRDNIIITAGDAIENVLINGDDSGTHMDNDVTGATDKRKAWKGFRRLAIDASMTETITTLTTTNLRAIKKSMGKFAINGSKNLWILGVSTNDLIVGLTIGNSNQGFKDYVTISDGVIQKLYGIPVITSGHQREDLTAAGVYDGTTTDQTTILNIHTPRQINGNRRALTIKTAEKIESDQVQVVGSFRRGFKSVRTPNATTTGASAEATVSMGIAVDAS